MCSFTIGIYSESSVETFLDTSKFIAPLALLSARSITHEACVMPLLALYRRVDGLLPTHFCGSAARKYCPLLWVGRP